jgi:hypothetical protein
VELKTMHVRYAIINKDFTTSPPGSSTQQNYQGFGEVLFPDRDGVPHTQSVDGYGVVHIPEEDKDDPPQEEIQPEKSKQPQSKVAAFSFDDLGHAVPGKLVDPQFATQS